MAAPVRPAWSLPPEPVAAPYPAPALPAQSSAQLAALSTQPFGYPYASPYGYGVPPYFGGYPMVYPLFAEPSRDTLRGLGRLRMATFVALAACGVSTVVGGFALYLFFNPGVAPGILSLPPALGLQLVAFLLQLVAVAIGWSAFEEVSDAAREINAEHATSARR